MKIVMITGSPRRNGATALLAEGFQEGAKAAGHTVTRFDAAQASVGPCRACEHCLSHEGNCVQQDDMALLRPPLMEADAVVLVTPLYYSGMSAQLKTVIDRFFAFDGEFRKTRRKSVLLAACGDDAHNAMNGLLAHYSDICDYLNWEKAGHVLALAADSPQTIAKSDYPAQARRLGETI